MNEQLCKIKSQGKVGKILGFAMMPHQTQQMALDKSGKLVQQDQVIMVPVAMLALKDMFAVGPLTDLEPVWEDVELDSVTSEEELEPVGPTALEELAAIVEGESPCCGGGGHGAEGCACEPDPLEELLVDEQAPADTAEPPEPSIALEP